MTIIENVPVLKLGKVVKWLIYNAYSKQTFTTYPKNVNQHTNAFFMFIDAAVKCFKRVGPLIVVKLTVAFS